MSSSPTLLYRVTGRLNRLLWRMPLPRRLLVRLSALVYRNPPMPGETVVAIVDALLAADMRCWISGGWGVDALAGEHTRVHRDLDLVIERKDRRRAIEVLGGLDYSEWYTTDSDVPLFSRVVLHDHELAGRAIDLHPVDLASMHMEFTTGTIAGREVLCFSPELQIKTHANYRKRWRDRTDLAILRKLIERPVTTLIVPVSRADGVLQKSARETGLPAHITLLYPFLSAQAVDGDTELALASVLRKISAFDFILSEVGSFPGVVYLTPRPTAPFVELTEALVKRWPEQQPHGGAYEEIIPHLTVAYGGTVPSGLVEQLPISARAHEVWLMSRIAGRWVRRASFALGSSTAAESTEVAVHGDGSDRSFRAQVDRSAD
jgi:2'-5' RNA ligase